MRLQRVLLLALIAGLIGGLAPAFGQNRDDLETAPPIEMATWIEDFSGMVRAIREEYSADLHLNRPEIEGGVIFADEAPLFSEWDIEDIAERFEAQFSGAVVVIVNSYQLALSVPKDQQEGIRAFAKRLRSTWQSTARIRVTPLTAQTDAWMQIRREFRDAAGIEADRFWNYLRRFTAPITIGGTVESRARNGEQVRLENLQRQAYVRTLGAQTAVGQFNFDPVMGEFLAGYSLTWQPYVIRNGARVWLELHGQSGTAPEMNAYSMTGGDSTIGLPSVTVADIHATIVAEPGQVYLISPGRRGGDDTATAFVVEVFVDAPRAAELPGESVRPGLASKRYDVFELCLPWNHYPHRLLVAPSGPVGTEDLPYDTIDYDALPEYLEALCPDWETLSSRGSELSLVGGGYIEVVNTPAAHTAIRRVLTALHASRPAPLATDVVALRLTRDQIARFPELRGTGPISASPENILRYLPRDEWPSMTAIDTTIWHHERQMISTYLARESAFVADFSVHTQENAGVAQPVIDVLAHGFAFSLFAQRALDGESWDIELRGQMTHWDGNLNGTKYETRSANSHVTGGQLHQPRTTATPISVRATAVAGAWSVTQTADPLDPTRIMLIFLRTRLGSN